MLKKSIKYTDFNGDEVTEVFYFNLSKTELLEMEVGAKDGMEKMINRIVESKDAEALVKEFKKIILSSYGQKSEDGKRFIKTDQLREEFVQTAAYDALFMELSTDADAGAAFVTGIVPKDMQTAPVQDKPVLPPSPPST